MYATREEGLEAVELTLFGDGAHGLAMAVCSSGTGSATAKGSASTMRGVSAIGGGRITGSMKIRTAVLTSLVTIAVPSVAGCGGGDDDKGPSKQEFIAQADAICEKGDKDQTAVVGKETQGAYGNFSDAAFLSQYNAVTRDALKRLRALDAPEEDRKAVDDVLSALDQNVAAVDRRIAALQARDLPSQSQAMRDFHTSYGDVVASAGALGLTQCQALGN